MLDLPDLVKDGLSMSSHRGTPMNKAEYDNIQTRAQ